MKTEFNVERVCERVQLCVVEAPDELGHAMIEVRGGSIYVSFPAAPGAEPNQPITNQETVHAEVAETPTKQPAKPKRKGR